jgi:ankyrin repeat protein
MNTPTYNIIGDDQKEYGPLTVDQLNQWIQEGRLNGATEIRSTDSRQWKLLREVPEFAALLRPPPPTQPVKRPASSLADISFTLGIISSLTICFGIITRGFVRTLDYGAPSPLAIFANLLGLLAVIFGTISFFRKVNKLRAATGIVTGGLGFLPVLLALLVLLLVPSSPRYRAGMIHWADSMVFDSVGGFEIAVTNLQIAVTNWPSSEIHEAAWTGNLARVKALLKDNTATALTKDNNGWTPLHLAVFNGHKDVAELLLANKADVNAKDNDGKTPLQIATGNGYNDVVELLLANKAAINAKDNNGETALHWAVEGKRNHKDMVEMLLANKADVNSKDNNGDTALHWAVGRSGDKDIAELLLANKAEVNAKDNKGTTPLLEAAGWDMVEMLLTNKADVNAKDNKGMTPLMRAAASGAKDVVELLLDNKADVNAKDNNGSTALHFAMIGRFQSSRDWDWQGLAEVLREHGGHE